MAETKRQQLEQDVMHRMALRGMSIRKSQAKDIVAIVIDGLREPTDMMVVAGSMEVPALTGIGAARNYARSRWDAMLDEVG